MHCAFLNRLTLSWISRNIWIAQKWSNQTWYLSCFEMLWKSTPSSWRLLACLDAFVNSHGMVNKEQFNNAVLDNGIVQSKIRLFYGIGRDCNSFHAAVPRYVMCMLLHCWTVVAMPGKQLKKDGWMTRSMAELLLLILHGVSMKYKAILKVRKKKKSNWSSPA